MADDSLYDRLGRREGIAAVVEAFYDRVLADELLAPLFADSDVQRLRELLTDFVCDAAGGPESYDGPPVRAGHLHVPLEAAHVERAVELLEATLAESDVPEEDADAVLDVVLSYEDDLLATAGE